MKKVYFMAVLLVGSLLVSCGVSKNSATSASAVKGRVAQELSEAQLYAMSAPKGVLRAYGEYTLDEEGFAMRYATAQARANLAEIISAKVTTGIEMYRNSYKKTAITADETKTVKDADGSDQQLIRQVSEESISGAAPVKVSTYVLPNGTYQVYVCVEADAAAIATYVAHNATVQQLVSDEDRMKIDYNRDQFREGLLAELNK